MKEVPRHNTLHILVKAMPEVNLVKINLFLIKLFFDKKIKLFFVKKVKFKI